MKYILMILPAAAIVCGIFTGRLPEVSTAVLESASGAVTLALTLCGSMARSDEGRGGSRGGEAAVGCAFSSGRVAVPGTGKGRTRRAAHLHESLGEYPRTWKRDHTAWYPRDGSDTGRGGRLRCLRRLRQRQHDNADRPEHSEPSAHSGDRRGAHDRPRSRPTDGNTPLRVDRIGVFPGGFGGRGKAVRAFFQEEGAACR